MKMLLNAVLVVLCVVLWLPLAAFATTPPVFPNMSSVNVTIKLGPEFSSLSKGNDTDSVDNKNALGSQYFFTEIAARFNVCYWFDLTPQLRFGKINTTSDKIETTTNLPTVIKDASAIGGKIEATAYIWNKSFYFRAAPEFSYINNDLNKDAIFDSFFGFGIQVTKDNTPYRDSYFEFGYGYSERMPTPNRFKANLQLIYKLSNMNMRPFIKAAIDSDLGKGGDDIRVMYGVEIPAANVWESIKNVFTTVAGVQDGKK